MPANPVSYIPFLCYDQTQEIRIKNIKSGLITEINGIFENIFQGLGSLSAFFKNQIKPSVLFTLNFSCLFSILCSIN